MELTTHVQIPAVQHIEIDSAKLRAARESTGLNMAEAARRLGIARQQLWNYETGLFNVPSKTLVRLCALYGVSIADLSTSPESFFASPVHPSSTN